MSTLSLAPWFQFSEKGEILLPSLLPNSLLFCFFRTAIHMSCPLKSTEWYWVSLWLWRHWANSRCTSACGETSSLCWYRGSLPSNESGSIWQCNLRAWSGSMREAGFGGKEEFLGHQKAPGVSDHYSVLWPWLYSASAVNRIYGKTLWHF